MAATRLQMEAWSKLCSRDQLDLLDSVDRLRSQGINKYVSLPQIIVCGDQSAGKSSVLEAVTGVSFPVKTNLCTRFPIELILRRMPLVSSRVSIVPHASRTAFERASLAEFHETLDCFDCLADVIEDAKEAMGIHTQGKTFSNDLLRIEITGPDRPHLTIVDLPGLIQSPTNNLTVEDVDLIQDIVGEYMADTRSVILAVISAKDDPANQKILEMATKADPNGNRTMGIVTKPDHLTPGSLKEQFYVSLSQNEEIKFRLGWHVLKNMDSDKGLFTLVNRNTDEEAFFSQSIWQHLPNQLLGIFELRTRLSKVLMRQIAYELPSVIKELESKLKACREQLGKRGQPRITTNEQRLYLVKISQNFQILTKASVDGVYTDSFFEDTASDRGYCQRIRAVIQTLNQQFARELEERGQYRQIVDVEVEETGESSTDKTVRITRDDFISYVQNLMLRARGRELPDTFSPMIVADLLQEQCRPWKPILRDHVQRVGAAARRFLHLVCAHTADETACRLLLQEIVNPAMDRIVASLHSKADELSLPHTNGHPTTYNHYFMETLQRARDERGLSEARSVVARWLGEEKHGLQGYCDLDGTFSTGGLDQDLTACTEPDMDRLAASEALDCMMACYKVALKRFTDDVAVELVETKLMKALPDILTPTTICSMSTDQVGHIAAESDEDRRKRDQLSKQFEVLSKGSDFCKRFVGMKLMDVIMEQARGSSMVGRGNKEGLGQAEEKEPYAQEGLPPGGSPTVRGSASPDDDVGRC